MKARALNNLLCYYTENDVSTKARENVMIKERYTNVDLKISLFHLVHVKMMP